MLILSAGNTKQFSDRGKVEIHLAPFLMLRVLSNLPATLIPRKTGMVIFV